MFVNSSIPSCSTINFNYSWDTLCICCKYLRHFCAVTVSQNLIIPATSSSLEVGLTSRLTNSVSSCQRFSIGFRSGLSAGVGHRLADLSVNEVLLRCFRCTVCSRPLSCINWCLSGYTFCRNGTSIRSRISMYTGPSIIPSNTKISVSSCMLIPAQTRTLVGCLGL